jgi:hypothetical protein
MVYNVRLPPLAIPRPPQAQTSASSKVDENWLLTVRLLPLDEQQPGLDTDAVEEDPSMKALLLDSNHVDGMDKALENAQNTLFDLSLFYTASLLHRSQPKMLWKCI